MRESVRRAFEALVGGDAASREEVPQTPAVKLLRIRERASRPQSLTRDALFEHAKHLAQEQIAEVSGRGSRELYQSFASHCVRIDLAHRLLSTAALDRDLLTPGAEWLLDNYHIIQEQIASIRRDFPRGYDRTLPKLLSGRHRGYPRVYELALELISKSDSVVDGNLLTSFINGYQSISQLTLGELWATPIMLRFALVENVSHLAERFVGVREERKLAESFIDEIIGDESRAGTEILLVLAGKLKAEPELLFSSAPYLIRRLRERGRKATITLQWLEERLREDGAEPEEILRNEQYALAADQISIGNTVTSLKAIGFIDWKSWVEAVSLAERALRRDPGKIYPQCDFKTRDIARHTIEKLAKRGDLLESAVAEGAVKLADRANALPVPTDEAERIRWTKRSNVTYYLIREGIWELEKELGIAPGILNHIARSLKRHAFLIYASVIILGTVCAASALLRVLAASLPELGLLMFFLALIPASELVTNIVQWLVTRIIRPDHLPKLDYQRGIPPEARTAVVVHSLFSDSDAASATIEGLEVRYLANPDPNVVFGVLADVRDATAETRPGDEEIIALARKKISGLNEKHGERFFLLFRKRKFNPSEGKWMAWERKRGKLEQFNELLLDRTKTADFLFEESDLNLLHDIRYVLTLDNDSTLPRGAVQRLVGTGAHPLNAPVIDSKTNRVVEGYGIIQPRVGTTLTSAHASRFARMFSGQAGLDPYSETVSEVHQDLFGEGSFVGKGLYSVGAFHQVLQGRVPENSLLSHDLFEGNFARAGLATDIELFDDYPSKYHAHARRHHRWVRGDWQLVPWLRSRIPAAAGQSTTNVISSLGHWKMMDNLRRSLVAPSIFIALVVAWLLLPNPARETLLALLVIAFPVYANVAQAFIIPPKRTSSLGSHVRGIGREMAVMSQQAVFTLAVLPHQATLMCDAIFRTLYRVFISKRHLLEWETAYYADKRLDATASSFFREMRVGFLVTVIFTIVLSLVRPEVALRASPILLLWLTSPWLAYLLSSPIPAAQMELNHPQREYLFGIAWHTWRYFRELVNEQNHYLVPDNIQLTPNRVVANRTSPTNISLSLLGAVSAYELGFFSLTDVVKRVRATVETLPKLERFRGHFLNWYDCLNLNPLYPRYVSTVDSGNFIGNLIALRAFFQNFGALPLVGPAHAQHSLRVIQEARLTPADPLHTTSIVELVRSALPLKERSTGVVDGKLRRDLEDLCRPVDYLGWVEIFERIAAAHPPEIGSPLAAAMNQTVAALQELPTVDAIGRALISARVYLHALPEDLSLWQELSVALIAAETAQTDLRKHAATLVESLSTIITEHDFTFLYDSDRDLFAIGYHVDNARRDGSFYDLLASEARLSALVTIALGQAPLKHWFALGRALTNSAGGRLLLSWSGTMFEYLMPLVVTRDYSGTLLSESYKAVVRAQRIYGERRGVPWGISESSFSGVDFEKTYQYRAFGVPGLGLKRGLEDDLVISPYSTALALMVASRESIENFEALEQEGGRGEYGFFEAIDYTPARLAVNERKHVVQNFFAHHQGMSLCSLVNVLCDSAIQKLFHSDPIIRATELLLQERFPDRVATLEAPVTQPAEIEHDEESSSSVNATVLETPHTAIPRTHLLSNGRYAVMLDNAGSGYSAYERELFLTRWREDLVSNQSGSYLYLRDRKSNFLWSNTYQPTCVEPESYEVLYSSDKVEFKRRDRNLFVHTEVTVSPEDNVEIRRVSLINLAGEKRTIEVTSFGEVALNSFRADQAHPAFSKMFIQSEFLPDYDCLVFARRPRSVREQPQFFFHMLTMKTVWERVDFDSSRFSFIGRGRSVENPDALDGALARNQGSILDPIFALRTGLEIDPSHVESLNFISGYAANREELMLLIRRYKELHQISRAFEMAWSQASVELRNEQMSAKLFPVFQRLGNALLFNVTQLRGSAEVIQRNKLAQQNLWRFGISGDLPMVVVRVTEPSHIKLVQELLAAHSYLRVRGLAFDLVILNEYPGGYLQTLHEELDYTIRNSHSGWLFEKSGGVFLRSLTQMNDDERDLLAKVARVLLNGAQGSLATQIRFEERSAEIVPRRRLRESKLATTRPKLEFDNSYGGFIDGGKGYRVVVGRTIPPLPYANVIANPAFGFLVTESGGGYTWAENARENRLTPWSNDPVTDPVSEAIYIRDAVSGQYWSATPLPASHGGEYVVEHRAGISRFKTENAGVESVLQMSIASTERLKLVSVLITNRTKEVKSLELVYYVECVLGVFREEMARYLNTAFDPLSKALMVTNNYNSDFPGRVAIVGSSKDPSSYTASRAEFLGRNRSGKNPLALDAALGGDLRLTRKLGAGFDPCAALKVDLKLAAGESSELLFYLGEFPTVETARTCVAKLRQKGAFAKESEQFLGSVRELTEAVSVETPERTFDLIMNGWLPNQVVSSRLYGRTGLYQSGGAFGFRDQLQDVLALLYSRPPLVREQLLLHASRQFPEGDVQHWWHPPSGKGVRTKISDDFLWLPFVASRYREATGDQSIFDEVVHFLDGPMLGEHEHEAYIVPRVSEQKDTFYSHCVRALDHGLRLGSHGLPLMGVGDWNDGMNEVGKEGRGESVWLAWFLALTLKEFLPIVEQRSRENAGEAERLERYRTAVENLVNAVEEHAWDGEWYRRAYFDDGTPLGSATNDECQIDSLPQSWSVLSGLGRPDRQQQSMQAVYSRLVDERLKLIKLFDPPFDKGSLRPGYIKGYLPGVRENGGQYTHAAVWVLMAAAELGDGERAFRYFQYINPVSHTSSKSGADRYMGEPYVLCGDVYAAPPFEGRAGWSWYTGSAGWLYQAGLCNILGLHLHPEGFSLKPCIPAQWDKFKIVYRRQAQVFTINVRNPKKLSRGAVRLRAAGKDVPDGIVCYSDLPAGNVQIDVELE